MGGKKPHTCRVVILTALRKCHVSIEQVFTSKDFETNSRVPAIGRDFLKSFMVQNRFTCYLGLVPFIPCNRPMILSPIIVAGKK